MANVYGRLTKITNAVGRSDYISNHDQQDEIVLHKMNMQHSWEEHSSFEKANQKTNVANNEALEVVVALPNDLEQNQEKLEAVCNDLVKEIVGENKDYEYAVHWNHNRTNLHAHILFSERENQLDLVPKIYKRDIYYNFEEKKLSKKSDPKAEIIHHKGDIQKDAEGNIKYESDIFKAKDTRFIQGSFVHDKNRAVEKVLKSYGYDLTYQDKDSQYLAQKKLYKGASKDYLDKAKAWNEKVKKYNEGVKQHIALEPNQLENYKTIKKEILAKVKEANAEEKKITPRAIELVEEMVNWIEQTLMQVKGFIKQKTKEIATMTKWGEIKDKFVDLFKENTELESNTKELNQAIDNYNKIDKGFTEVIDSKKSLINDIEEYEEKRNKDYGKEL